MKVLYDKMITISDIHKYQKDSNKIPQKLVFFNSIQDVEYGINYYVGSLKEFYLKNPDSPFRADDGESYKFCISPRFVIGDGKAFGVSSYLAKYVGEQIYRKPFVDTEDRYYVAGYSYECLRGPSGLLLDKKNLYFYVDRTVRGGYVETKKYSSEDMLKEFSFDKNGTPFGKTREV